MHLGPEAERIVPPIILQQNQISEIVFSKYQKQKIIQCKKDNMNIIDAMKKLMS